MIRQEKIASIRQKCIEANPEARWYTSTLHGPGLADVLLASNERHKTSASLRWPQIVSFWNLRQDDLTEQSDECITFLADLLQ